MKIFWLCFPSVFQIDVHSIPHTLLFPKDKTVYLTPDSDKPLTDIDKDKIYIIGGLVDESISKVRPQRMSRVARKPIFGVANQV